MRAHWRLAPLLAFGVLASGCMPMDHGHGDVGAGKTAPEIAGTDGDGMPMKLSDFRGKVVLLDFWQTH